MIEIPESTTISRQATDVLKGKIVADVINATSPQCGSRIIKEAYLGGCVYYCPCGQQ